MHPSPFCLCMKTPVLGLDETKVGILFETNKFFRKKVMLMIDFCGFSCVRKTEMPGISK